MKLAYASTYDPRDVRQWSGTPFYMTKAFEQEGVIWDYLGPLQHELPPGYRLKQLWKRYALGLRESSRFNQEAIQAYARQLSQKMSKLQVQALVAPQVNPIAYLDCEQPIVLWTDALYAGLLGFYPATTNLSPQTVEQGNQITAEALSRCRLLVFSSDWAARSALELYGVSKEKVKVVPFGANLDCEHDLFQVKEFIKQRSRETLKLLFIGREWEIKGGPLVYQVAKALHEAGQPVELNIVGCYPTGEKELPSYIKCHGFISKREPEGMAKIKDLLRQSHFMFVPSRAECFGMIFAEANAFGLPNLTTYVGGIGTVVKDGVNGRTFSREASVEEYCQYLMNLMGNYSQYEELALSSFNEYQTRLNWGSAVRTVRSMIEEIA